MPAWVLLKRCRYRRLGRAHTGIGQPLAQFLIHQHGFIGQLKPDRTQFFVFQPNRAGRGFDREHAVLFARGGDVKIPWRFRIGLNSDGLAQLTRQATLVNALGNGQFAGRERRFRRVYTRRDLGRFGIDFSATDAWRLGERLSHTQARHEYKSQFHVKTLKNSAARPLEVRDRCGWHAPTLASNSGNSLDHAIAPPH